MDKELINVLSNLFDEKLKPIKEEIAFINNRISSIEKRLDSLEEKIDTIQELTSINAENVEIIKENLWDIEYTVARNRLDLIKLKNIKNKRG